VQTSPEGANLSSTFATNVNFKQADLDQVNFTNARIHNSNVYQASMNDMTLNGADIVETGIGVGGEDVNIPDWE
jgi:uncharacterized protein YjbI with pentapeptide repeats